LEQGGVINQKRGYEGAEEKGQRIAVGQSLWCNMLDLGVELDQLQPMIIRKNDPKQREENKRWEGDES